MSIYQRIKLRRQELKMTQQELADKTGYNNRSAIARIERGDTDLSQSKIMVFAKALKCSSGWLLDGSENRVPKTDLTMNQEEMLGIMADLTPDEQLQLLGMARFMYYQRLSSTPHKKSTTDAELSK